MRSNAVASVWGVRQSVSQIEQLHRKPDIAQRPLELRDEVRLLEDVSLENCCLPDDSLADNIHGIKCLRENEDFN